MPGASGEALGLQLPPVPGGEGLDVADGRLRERPESRNGHWVAPAAAQAGSCAAVAPASYRVPFGGRRTVARPAAGGAGALDFGPGLRFLRPNPATYGAWNSAITGSSPWSRSSTSIHGPRILHKKISEPYLEHQSFLCPIMSTTVSEQGAYGLPYKRICLEIKAGVSHPRMCIVSKHTWTIVAVLPDTRRGWTFIHHCAGCGLLADDRGRCGRLGPCPRHLRRPKPTHRIPGLALRQPLSWRAIYARGGR